MPAVSAANLGKRYTIYRQPADRVKEWILPGARHIEKWAIRNAYFDVEAGSILGVIGENGSGKSTLARLIAGVCEPTEGTLKVDGRIAGVLELGAGFHPDFTGRDNILMASSFHGFSRRDAAERMPQIVEFSELGEAIDLPVRTYSTGMFLRLGFSLAIHVDADVLVFDEVLAVGDEYYRGKCFNYINRLHESGKAIILVSHDMSAIRSMCHRVLLLEGGRIIKAGTPDEVALDYVERMRLKLEGRQGVKKTASSELRWGNGKIEVDSVRLYNAERETAVFLPGETMIIESSFVAREGVRMPVFGTGIFRSDGAYVSGFNHLWHADPRPIEEVHAGNRGRVRCVIRRLPLLPGSYFLSQYCYDHSQPAPEPITHIECAARFTVLPGRIEEHGMVHMDSEWLIELS